MTITAEELGLAIERVSHAVSRDRKLPVLQCVLMETRERSVRLVATDRHRLAVSEVGFRNGHDAAPFRALVPATSLAWVHGIEPDAVLTMRVDGDSLHVQSDAGTQTVTLAPGDFPDYEKFLAADPGAKTLIVDRTAFTSAIEAVSDDEPLRFRFTVGSLELGEPEPSRLPAVYDDADVSFLLEPTFAHDAARLAAGPDLAIEADTPVSPVVFRSPTDDTYTCIVMPVRTREPSPRRRRR